VSEVNYLGHIASSSGAQLIQEKYKGWWIGMCPKIWKLWGGSWAWQDLMVSWGWQGITGSLSVDIADWQPPH